MAPPDFSDFHSSMPVRNLSDQDQLDEMEMDELAFSEVFGVMIEDAVYAMNDIGTSFGELDRITELSDETASLKRRSTMKSASTIQSALASK